MSNEQLIHVLVADDHAVLREGIRQVLSNKHGFDVVAEAGNGAETLALAAEHKPDVVLLDITMPGDSGLETAARLRADVPEARILILTMHDRGEYVLEAVRAGAHGYVLKDAPPSELRTAVKSVHDGLEYFSQAAAGKLNDALRNELVREQQQFSLNTLTAREREVLALVASGDTSKEIAEKLGISPRTVESHRENVSRKLRIRSVAQLTRFAVDVGLVEA